VAKKEEGVGPALCGAGFHTAETVEIPGMEMPETPSKARRRPPSKEPAPELSVARVAVDMSLPHLDRCYDYRVPTTLHEKAVTGCRVRVRFAGQLVDGFLLERVEDTEHEGRLSFIERVTSSEPVLTPEIAALAREVADRYAGTLADVLRLAIPPRHAKTEAEPAAEPAEPPEPAAEPGPWSDYNAGPSFLTALAAGQAPRAIWNALPGPSWPSAIARAVRVTLAAGRGALVVAADGGEVARLDAALTAEIGDGRHVALTAELGPSERYRRWLTLRRGSVRAVVGTRAAMFAPIDELGLVVLWDDGDDVHADPHAPYPHAREVLALRAHRAGAAALIGGHTRTTDTTQLIDAGWAHPLVPDREVLRRTTPVITPSGDDAELARDAAARSARLPQLAFRAARQGLETGPVLVQVPRRGYVPAIACGRCRGPARCTECEGPLALNSSHAAPYCRWCGRIAGDWRCPECEGTQVRAVVIGARRTAEELGRAFPSVPIRTSGRDGVLARVGPESALIVSTPGAEPVADEGYAAALMLDGWALLGRADLRAGEETLRRWFNAAALTRPGAPVIVLADSRVPAVQALIRWDPVTFAERELAERRELGFPPAVRMASLTGSPQAIRELVEAAELPDGTAVLGPVEVGEGQERALVRAAKGRGVEMARALKAATGARSTRKVTDTVRVQVDPLELI
jgi:primosomal protein N' (replication factor Y) (superfamily II helicase)